MSAGAVGMTNADIGNALLAALLLLVGATVAGHAAARMRQPRIVGELLAGIALGPSLFGQLAPSFRDRLFGRGASDPNSVVLDFLYEFGLLLLMFVSGCAVRHLLGTANRRATALILGIGTPVPFLVTLLVAPHLHLDRLIGSAGNEEALVLVLAAAAAVTSIPVITKIFYDLGILHTRFASLQLGSAVVEDIALWSIVAVASALAGATLSAEGSNAIAAAAPHLAVSAAFVAVALVVMPSLLRDASRARWNIVASRSPTGWLLAVFLGYVAAAAALGVPLAFAALLAGYGVMGGVQRTEQERFRTSSQSITDVAGSFFVPLYFAMVGTRIDLPSYFDPVMLVQFLVGSSCLVFVSVAVGAKLAGMTGLDAVNLAITQNARGGPGIVMASVAFEAGIINAPFFTTLVLTALVTSQACGAWLDHVLRRGWPLLSDADLRRRGIEPEHDAWQPAPVRDRAALSSAG